MKHAIALSALVLSLAAPAAAQTQPGESILDLGVGFGAPVGGLDLTRFGGGGERPGGLGLALSPRYLHQFTAAFGLGAELAYLDFPAKAVSLPGGPAAADGSLLAVEAVGRYLTRPQAAVSPYLTAGVGVGRMAATVEQGGTKVLDAATTGLELSPGAGLRADLGSKVEGSAEFRWRLGSISRSEFGTGVYNVLSVLLRLGWRS